ncbi:MAG: primary-amine oxidase, partial [Natronomonas sp.]
MSKQKQTPVVDHPLEQLTAEEIETAVDIFEAESELGSGVQYHNVMLNEPPKSATKAFEPGDPFDREVDIVARKDRETYEATVSLTEEELKTCEHIPDVEPGLLPEEIEGAQEAVKNDPEWREAAKKRGVEDFDLVMVDPWAASGFEPEGHEGERICRAISWIRSSPNDNGRARPIEGLFAFVNVDEMEVVEIEDNGVPDPDTPLPPEDADYRADRVETRDDFEHL